MLVPAGWAGPWSSTGGAGAALWRPWLLCGTSARCAGGRIGLASAAGFPQLFSTDGRGGR